MNVMQIHRDQRGMVGKLMAAWLLMAVLVGVVGYDVVSIGLTTFRMSDVAAQAATDGVVKLGQQGDTDDACEAARATVEARLSSLKLGMSFCTIDTESEEVTITLRSTANTLLLGRLGFTEEHTKIVQTETAGESAV